MEIKNAPPGWKRGPRQEGAQKCAPLPGGGLLRARVWSSGEYEVTQIIGERRGVVASGSYEGALGSGCHAAQSHIDSIVRAARRRQQLKQQQQRTW